MWKSKLNKEKKWSLVFSCFHPASLNKRLPPSCPSLTFAFSWPVSEMRDRFWKQRAAFACAVTSRFAPKVLGKHHSACGQKVSGHVELNIKPEQEQFENFLSVSSSPIAFKDLLKKALRFALRLRACSFYTSLLQRSQPILPSDLSLSRHILCGLKTSCLILCPLQF